jgi:flagellar M-ring protein FliF
VFRPNQKPGEAAIRSEQSSNSSHTNALPAQGIPGALTNQPPANPTADIVDPPPANAARGGAANQRGTSASRAESTSTQDLGTRQTAQKDSGSNRNDATINYEVDRTISHTKAPLGKLQRLSVAVVVNFQRNKDGELAPLAASELAKLENLAREAMGYSAQRGDTLSLINSPFNESDEAALPLWMNPLYQGMAMEAGRYLLIALLLFFLWLKVLKPLLHNIEIGQTKQTDINAARVAAEALERESEAAAEKRASEISRYEDNLNTARAMAKKDPRAIAMVLRTWMGKNGKR